jgi:heme-degrading monooxygenase HmoA
MIYRIVKLTFKEEEIAHFFEIFEANKLLIAGAKGCTSMRLMHDLSDRRVVFTYSTWEGENFLELYRASAAFKAFWGTIKPLFLVPAEVSTLESCHWYAAETSK